MIATRLVPVALVLFWLAGCAAPAPAGNGDAGATTAAAEAPVASGEDAVMQAFMAYMTPGPQHARLLTRVGTWDVEITTREAPGAPPTVSSGVCEVEAIFGGRYLVERLESRIDGQPYEGMSVTGYDNFRRRFMSDWVDSISTGIMHSEGEGAGGMITYTTESPDYAERGYKTMRMIDTMVSETHRRLEMFDRAESGREFKAMEIEYRKRE